ncbi:PH domain-containing protein [Candidatus Dojkabacteria bacterium]|nr:PH domain-containing protein [Candidatus Dojkabacteria bacterium]
MIDKQQQRTEKRINKTAMTLGRQLNRFRSGTLFSKAYSFPQGIELDGQEPKEKIILVFRSHPITLFPRFISSIGLFLIAVILPVILNLTGVKFSGAVIAGSVFLVLASITNFIYTMVFWFYNMNIITTERMIDVDFNGLMSYRVSQAAIENIEDVSVSNVGLWASIFNYGTIYVQTAGETPEFEFTNVSEPSRIQDILNDLIELKQKGVQI